MKTKFIANFLYLGIGILFFLGNAMGIANANLIQNGDFETGDLTGWSLMPYTSGGEAYVSD